MMNYIFKLSGLEHIALTKITITLWNQSDVRDLTTHFLFQSLIHIELDVYSTSYDESKSRKAWQAVENKVIENARQLLLPEPLKKKVLNLIKPIGLNILSWRQYHDQYFHLGRDILPNELCWTPHGTVDKKKTAEMFVKNENLDITNRYKLACVYCLEDDISELWDKIPENRREEFYSEEDPIEVIQQDLVVLWTYEIKGELDKVYNMISEKRRRMCSPAQYAFEDAARRGNEVASEYFFPKLTHREREESLVTSARQVAHAHCYFRYENPLYLPNVLCFLLSQMYEDQQIEVFRSNSYEVLECLLDWPWQRFFMETASCMWDFLSQERYHDLLEKIIRRVIKKYKDYDYQKLFVEFWQQSPNAFKKFVISTCVSIFVFLLPLLEVGERDNVRLILENATVKEREEIILSDNGKVICKCLVNSNKWDSLKIFIEECISSKEAMIKFKVEWKKHIKICSVCVKEYTGYKWDKFFQLVDDLIQENKKRNIEEGDSSMTKRFHSTEFTRT